MGKVIHWELCKKQKLDHSAKWYIDNPESVQENEGNEIMKDFEIQTDHLIQACAPDLVDFTVLADHRVKIKENEKGNKYLDLSRKLKS